MLFDSNQIFEADDVFYLNADNLKPGIDFLIKNPPKKMGIYCNDDRKRSIDFSFLNEFPDVVYFRCLTQLNSTSKINSIYSLSKLLLLDWSDINIDLDIYKFPNLRILLCDFSGNINLSNISQLHELTIRRASGLDLLPANDCVNKLTLWNYRGIDLNGIGNLSNLKDLTIRAGSNIKDINAICDINNIESIEFERVKKNLNYTTLSACKKIRKCYFRSGVSSCFFVSGLNHLQKFCCFGDILDNDLEPLINSPSLFDVYIYPFKKTYNVSRETFHAKFGNQSTK